MISGRPLTPAFTPTTNGQTALLQAAEIYFWGARYKSLDWSRRWDLNPGPADYESDEIGVSLKPSEPIWNHSN
jgi:hypothetical protein